MTYKMFQYGLSYDTTGKPIGRATGSSVGRAVGRSVGRANGSSVGRAVGREVGSSVGRANGSSVGRDVGRPLGREVGRSVGRATGRSTGSLGRLSVTALRERLNDRGKVLGMVGRVGMKVGTGRLLGLTRVKNEVGKSVGIENGRPVGISVGTENGSSMGRPVGMAVGRLVGRSVGRPGSPLNAEARPAAERMVTIDGCILTDDYLVGEVDERVWCIGRMWFAKSVLDLVVDIDGIFWARYVYDLYLRT